MAAPHVGVERIYDGMANRGEYRVLVDRLWPRGVKKEEAVLDEWAKDAAPTTDLRRWYGHQPERFDEFARRYRDELDHPPASEVVGRLRKLARQRPIVLVTATKDVDHSGARVLCDHLKGRRRGGG